MTERISTLKKQLESISNKNEIKRINGEIEFLQLAKECGYKVLSSYVNASTKVKVVCKNGHEREVKPTHFKSNKGFCKKCSSKTIHKSCEFCGKNFVTSYPNQKVCSDVCKIEKGKEKKEQKKAYSKAYREKNKEYYKKYREENKERISKLKKKFRQENQEKIKEYVKKYKKTDKYKFIKKNQRHKRKELSKNGVGITIDQWNECLKFFNYKCAYSGEECDCLQMEHIVPLTKGGEHSYYNIVPCIGNYNSSKGNKNMEEWYRKQPYFSEERLQKIYEYTNLMKEIHLEYKAS